MQIKTECSIPENLSGSRFDQALATLLPQYSRSRLTDWIAKGQITLNGHCQKPSFKVQGGEYIEILAEIEAPTPWKGEAMDLSLVYEDDALLVVNKPAKLVVHPGAGNPSGTLVNALLHYHPPLENCPRGGIIHRLDKDTTGLLVVAKTIESHHALVKALAAREIYRHYEAFVHGNFTGCGKIDAPIGRDPKNRLKMAVNHQGKPAITHYNPINHYAGITHLALQLETGRTHQIRVHMRHAQHPVVGDSLYGGFGRWPKGIDPSLRETLKTFPRQALHARKLILTHPITKETMTFEAPLPQDMATLSNTLQTKSTPR